MFHVFKRPIDPFPVTDKASFKNGAQIMTLTVKAAPAALVLGLKTAQAKISEIRDESPDAEKRDAALLFAQAIFGREQAEYLMEFYGDPLVVINVCGEYFKQQLAKKITKAQKK